MGKYIEGIKGYKYNYKLYSYIQHLGMSGNGGHYVCNCDDTGKNSWYRFNDSSSSKINVDKKIIVDSNVYCLFYELVE